MAHPSGTEQGGKAMKEGGNITILVLGDEGVGKSSLVSTFVSRHFSELVPGILTRVRLPPDPYLSNCTTTIIDTQHGDEALNSALSLGSVKRDGSLASMNSTSADSVSSLSRSHATNLAGSSEMPGTATGMTASREAGEAVVMPTLKEEESGRLEQSAPSKKLTSPMASTSPFRNIDAAVLIYDLDRMETFNRLESHWLPLIERCYSGELQVIVAGNKMDLLHQTYSVASASDNQFFARSRQQIITLLQRFKFVRQCIKCSAKNLLNVDEVFRKSQQSVLYPINPLFDLNAGKLTPACIRAFTRVFRIFDADGDGLLNDAELNAFQNITWGSTLIERDFSGWKKVVTQHNSYFQREGLTTSNDAVTSDEVLQNGKFTVAGFLTIFDVFISQNRLEVPWKVLRTFGYDDELNLNIPSSIAPPEGCRSDFENFSPETWRLNPSEVHFLSSLFHQFESDCDGMLSSGGIKSIFSVLHTPLPPWSETGEKLFEGCFSRPHIDRDRLLIPDSIADVAFEPGVEGSPSPPTHPSSPSVSASGITIASSSLPSVDVSKSSETSLSTSSNNPMSYLSWMNHWHMLCTISPSVCRAELYRLGHVYEIRTRMERKKFLQNSVPPVFIRALIFGSKDIGKFLIRKLCRGHIGKKVGKEKKELTWSSSSRIPETHCAVSETILPWNNDGAETAVHLVLTNIPEVDLVSGDSGRDLRRKLHVLLGKQSRDVDSVYDLALLVFDTADASSFEYVKRVENDFLTEDMPRMFVAMNSGVSQISMPPAIEHCKSMDLEAPIILSRDESRLEPSDLVQFIRCTQKFGQGDVRFRSTPHGEKKRREAALRRKIIWIGALTAGVTVVVGFTMARDVKRPIRSEEGSKGRGWLQRTFAFVPRMVSSMLKAVRQTSSM